MSALASMDSGIPPALRYNAIRSQARSIISLPIGYNYDLSPQSTPHRKCDHPSWLIERKGGNTVTFLAISLRRRLLRLKEALYGIAKGTRSA